MKKLLIISGLVLSNYIITIEQIYQSLEYDTFVISNPKAVKNIFREFAGIETKRILLRKIKEQDAEAIFNLASHPEVIKHTAALELVKTKEDAVALINLMMERYEMDLPTRWAMVDKASNMVIGICGFVAYNSSFCRGEIGYALNYEYWGKGFATEAAQAVIQFGFEHMNLNRIEATVDPDNHGSVHVIEKVGMKFEGILRQHIWSKGAFRDRKMYALLKNDFKK